MNSNCPSRDRVEDPFAGGRNRLFGLRWIDPHRARHDDEPFGGNNLVLRTILGRAPRSLDDYFAELAA